MEIVDYLIGKNAGGGGGSAKLQNKEVTITENGTSEVKPDSGYDGLKKVEITTNVSGKGKVKFLNYYRYGSSSSAGITSAEDVNKVLDDLTNNIDTSLVTDFNTCFCYFNRNDNVEIKKFPKLDYSSAEDVIGMFSNAHFDEIDLSGELFPGIIDITGMFYNCSAKKINLKDYVGDDLEYISGTNKSAIRNLFANCFYLEELDIDNMELSTIPRSIQSYMFSACGNRLPEGQYTKVYVKDATEQSWILTSTSSKGTPEGWSTANVIIAGSSDDHRND